MGTDSGHRACQQTEVKVDETRIGVKPEDADELLRARKAVLPSEVRRRERSVDNPRRGRSVDTALVSRHQGHTVLNREDVLGGYARERPGRSSRRRDQVEQLPGRTTNGWHHHQGAGNQLSYDVIQGFSQPFSGQSAQESSRYSQNTVYTPSAPESDVPIQEAVHRREEIFREGVSQKFRDKRDHSPVDVRVSVAQLRHSYLEGATNTQKAEQYVVASRKNLFLSGLIITKD